MKLLSTIPIAFAAVGMFSLSGLANAAKAHLECGAAACASTVTPWDDSVTGVDDLHVRADVFDVSFTAAPASSPFVFSSSAALPGHALTGVDAGDAVSAFYGGLLPPYGNGYNVAGEPGPAFITAFAPAGSLSTKYFGASELWDVAETTVGTGGVATKIFGSNGYSAKNTPISDNGDLYYTTWTAVAAPEIDPNFAISGLSLLAGGLAVLRRGRRAQHLSA